MKYAHALMLSLFIAAQTSCTESQSVTTQANENHNPLVAQRYGEALANAMANFIIEKNPVIKEEGMQAMMEEHIRKGKSIAADASMKKLRGLKGMWIGLNGEVQGSALLVDRQLFLSSDFETTPGIDLHLFLTNVVDPRTIDFPDTTAIDLGTLQRVYGAQTYDIPAKKDETKIRTAILWDSKLKMFYAMTQLSK